jgi:hypothetical protein
MPQLNISIDWPVVESFSGDVKTGTLGGTVSINTDQAGAEPELLPRLSLQFTLQYHLLVARVIRAEEFVVTDE